MSQTVTCPGCRTLLRSQRPIPAGVNLRCPGCRQHFVAPSIELPAPTRSAFGAPLLIAVSVSLLLGASIIGAAVILSWPTSITTLKPQDKDSSEKDSEKKALADRQRELEAEKLEKARNDLADRERKLEHAKIVLKAEQAAARGDHAEAEKLFSQALDLVPTDANTVKGLVAAKSALATTKKTTDDSVKRQQEIDALVTEGKKALGEKKYAAAVRALESALKIDPADKTARDALAKAQTALETDSLEKKKIEDFRVRVDAGKVAMKAQQFGEAVREFLAAERILPDDLNARDARKEAENKLAGVADKQKREAALANLLDQARTAQTATRYKEAVDALEAANRLDPNNRQVELALSRARIALKQAKGDNTKLLAQADEAARAGQYETAQRLVAEAIKNWAEDAQATRLQTTVVRMVDDGQLAALAYTRAIKTGVAAMALRNYQAAIDAYTEAIRLRPGDFESDRQLRRARRELEKEVRVRVEYDQQMRIGNQAMSRRAYRDAIEAYERALRAAPNDRQASSGLRQARYSQAMADGQRAMLQKRKNDAIEAFGAALREKPGDAAATNNLRQARLMKGDTQPNDNPPKDKQPKDKRKKQ